MSGTGKKTALHEHLKKIAGMRGIPFLIQMKSGPADVEEGEEEEAMQTTYETSHLHMGFDIARMSMQDKQKLRPILSNVRDAGAGGQNHRIVSCPSS